MERPERSYDARHLTVSLRGDRTLGEKARTAQAGADNNHASASPPARRVRQIRPLGSRWSGAEGVIRQDIPDASLKTSRTSEVSRRG
jgi:hypothetical protein